MAGRYTTQLQAGLGMTGETRTLLALWSPGMGIPELARTALGSGQFPTMSARRLQNVVAECFAPRLLRDGAGPAGRLKRLAEVLSSREVDQLLFLYTCRANVILGDFVRQVYWSAYRAGRESISSEDAREFVTRANQEGRTVRPWSESTVKRVAGYLTGACADFSLLEGGIRRIRRILPYRLEPRVAAFLAFDLHNAGNGDNRVIYHPEWELFGLEPTDVLNELKRLSRKGLFIVQHAGDVTRIAWQFDTMEESDDAIAQI